MKSKKLLTILLSAIITVSSISSVYAAGPVGIKSKYQPKTTTIFWEKGKQNNKKSVTTIASEKFSNFQEISKFFQQNISRFGLKKGSLKSTKTLKDEKGKTHYHTIYEVEGIPVYYGRIVFTTEKDSTISSINGGVDISFENENWKNKIKLSKEDAIAKAKNNIKYEELHDSKADLYLYNFEGKPYLVYLVDLVTDTGNWNVFVNAGDGSIVNKFNNTPTLTNTKDKKLTSTKKTNTKANNVVDVQGDTIKGKGKSSLNGIVDIDLTYKDGKYYLKNSNKNIYVYDINNKYIGYTKSDLLRASSLVENNSNEFIDDKHIIAVDTYINLGKTYDYYKDKFNRNSIDNKGMKVEAFVDYNAVGDAAWSEEFNSMFFGNGDGKNFTHMSRSLDIVGHEFSHGVTHKESNLKYENESGALNESFSDIMGVAIKGKNFKIGEDSWTPDIEGDAIRDMQDPSKGYQPAHMKDYRSMDIRYDNGGVHVNSGIINHAAYLIADGIEKLGVENSKDIMAKLFYTANCYEWDETTNFSKCRNDLIKVTKNLYGENSKYVQIVENAFDKVGITATPQLPL
ncbi:peptidase M4 family protein [Clostridium botulinum]|uniref:M4 family metallopeptidase n=1 Tax=Clostridium botulinum TaxID=1491 RepID=UPI0005F8C4C2|nr:M4 family metallopeptidase [Clostridium botulinum]MBY6799267.1 peptidase M4 family protein [Clostridium botulinum]NFC30469.1 peptidase M4 family protein [Clostridium botulinum]NFC63874.1 peptidase M4 family protein [Clostridium botulinum]NFC67675.1 peptidase M4 family protein [Clostridium botulinum]NFE39282.1 peptidase M4 family protein [Clostridium botulinum]